MILPSAVVLAAVIGYPVVKTALLSHTKYNQLSPYPPEDVGAANFTRLAQDPIFWESLGNTAIYTFGTVIIATAAGMLLAVLTENLVRGFRFLRVALVTPWAVPFIVVAFLFRYMLERDYGVVNAILTALPGTGDGVPWLVSSQWALPSVMAANIWTQIPFFYLLFSAALAAVPNEVVEAARVDKAGGWLMFWRIKLPFLRGAAVVGSLMMVIANFNDFAKIWAMTEGGPGYSTTTLVVYVYRLAFEKFHLGYASAVGVVWLAFLLAFAVVYVRLLWRREAK